MNVSIIIPTYNGRALLEKNLSSVLQAMRSDDELIIVDDASTDDSVKWMQNKFKLRTDECLPNQATGDQPKDILCYRAQSDSLHIKLLVNQKNERFGVSCNRGVIEAKHPFVVLLNNDVSPQKDFLVYVLPHFEESLVFAVGCKELASAEGNKEYGRSQAHFERGFYVHSRAEDQNGFDTAWVVGGSGAFRRSHWLELGGFDPAFKPAYGEDIDLSFRATQKGWKLVFEPKAVVYHNHESTNLSVFGKREIEIASFKNSLLFMWKTAPLGERVKHVFWLPYHLVFTSLRSQGSFFLGFLRAVKTILHTS